jgi:hypothetical protein
LVGLSLLAAAGCTRANVPQVAFDAKPNGYRLLETAPAWHAEGAFEAVSVATPARWWPPSTPRRTTGGGWGRHYPWRGKGAAPSWYGTGKHEPGRLVKVGAYYYPFYAQGKDVYPVYSMPYARIGNRFEPSYGPLPAFGPLSFTRAGAALFARSGD